MHRLGITGLIIGWLVVTLTGASSPAPVRVAAAEPVARPAVAMTLPGPPHPSYVPPTKAAIAALPDATYDAVIPGLIPLEVTTPPTAPVVEKISSDTALYGTDRSKPVARLSAKNFLGLDTVIVPVKVDGDWTLILTPSRQLLPSANNGHAPTQTAAWIRSTALEVVAHPTQRMLVSISAQTLSIIDGSGAPVQAFHVGVGTSSTPTPTDVTGYIQAKYLDPSQGQSEYAIQLTSLHAPNQDNPYGGNDGGLIGVHYEKTASGQVSHGCVRLPPAAIKIVALLPLGTLITIVS